MALCAAHSLTWVTEPRLVRQCDSESRQYPCTTPTVPPQLDSALTVSWDSVSTLDSPTDPDSPRTDLDSNHVHPLSGPDSCQDPTAR